MDIEAVPLRLPEQPDQPDGVLVERFAEIESEAVAVDAEARGSPPKQRHGQRRQAEARPRLPVLIFENGAEDAGEVADVLGHPKIMLHEALDAAGTWSIGVSQAAGDDVLKVEGEAFLRPAGDVMEMTADGPQEVLRIA